MAELIHRYLDQVVVPGGRRFAVSAWGQMEDGIWRGWLEFHAVGRQGPTLTTDTETTQPDREALGADYLVEGRVRRDGNRVRVTVRLVEARTDTQLWANSYDRDMSDCSAVQAKVSAAVVRSLAMELLTDLRPLGSGTRNPQAHQAYLIGLYHWNRVGTSGLDDAATGARPLPALPRTKGRESPARSRTHRRLDVISAAAPSSRATGSIPRSPGGTLPAPDPIPRARAGRCPPRLSGAG